MARDTHMYARVCIMFISPRFACGRLRAMAIRFEISLVHGESVLAKWTTCLKYVTLAEVQQHVPSGFERGTYKITIRDEDSHKISVVKIETKHKH